MVNKIKMFLKLVAATIGFYITNVGTYLVLGIALYVQYSLRIFINLNPEEITVSEIRYYVITFLLLTFVLVFAVLRLYNAVVQNTSQLLKFNIGLRKLKASMEKSAIILKTQRTSLRRNLGTFLNALNMIVNKIKNV